MATDVRVRPGRDTGPMGKARVVIVVLGLLLVAGIGGVAAGATGARVSGHLTTTSFTAAQAGSVKLTYRFSKTSSRFSTLLTFQNGSGWQTVKSTSKTGRFKGSHTVTVKSLFAGKPVNVGRYRLKLAADQGSTLLRFTVLKAVTAPPRIRPQAGTWVTTSLSGPVSNPSGFPQMTIKSMSFEVGTDQATVGKWGFDFAWDGIPSRAGDSCGGSGSSVLTSGQSSPITNGQFSSPNPAGGWSGQVSGFVDGTFDTATSAHGTATASGAGLGGPGCLSSGSAQTGKFSWTATWQPAG